ncbi:MAG: TonB-dependent receptor [Bacteroidota bacterium]
MKKKDILSRLLNFSLLIVFLLFAYESSLANNTTVNNKQEITIKGTITDAETNEPIAGANIVVKGTTNGTISDLEGNYTLSVPENAVIIFSFIGYKTQEIPVNDQTTINVALAPSSEQLDDVIVIAYGTTTRSNLTGSATALKKEELKDVFAPNISSMIQGKVAGLYARSANGRPGQAAEINIRGKGSINTTNSPLWVVNGIIYGNYEPSISPADVESVTILKDASATSLYGSRAANGVILVQTNKPVKGLTRINATVSRGITQLDQGKFSLMDAQELYDYHSSWNNNPWFSEELVNTNTDWVDIATQLGDAQEYNVSYSGGGEKISAYVSGTYFNETGAVKGYDYDRFSALANLNIQATERLNIRADLSGNYSNVEDKEHSLYNAFTYLPWDEPYNIDGSLRWPSLDTLSWYGRDQSNYLYNLQYNYSNSRANRVRLNLNGDYKITDWLTFSSMNNIYFSFWNSEYYTDPRSTGGWATNGGLSSSYSFSRSRLTNQMLRYKNDFDKHSINTFVAWEFSDSYYDNNNASGTGIAAGLSVLNATSEASGVSGSKGESARQSLLFNARYVYDDKYMATASFSREGSSSFGKDNQYGNFWSVSAGWNMHSESFMSNLNWLNVLKLTASYGLVGNAPGGFPGLGYYELTGQYNGLPAARPYQKGNPAISWESTKYTNIGLEAQFLNRFTLTLDLYDRNNSGLLYRVPLPAMTGYTGINKNIGEIDNKGFEVVVSSDIIKTNNFLWQMDVNLSYNKNEVIELYEGEPISSGIIRIEEGRDMDSYYTRIWHGVNPGNGEPLWEQVIENEDGSETIELTNDYNQATLQFTGQKSTPDFIGGVVNRLSYRNFTLSANIGFVTGLYLYNGNRELFDSDGSYPTFNNMNLAEGWSRWENPGDIATHPEALMGGNHDAHKQSSRFLEDASYIKLRNVSLSYSLPASIVRKAKLSTATVFLTADNLATFTKWSGMDPESGGWYPMAKKYLIGLKVDF